MVFIVADAIVSLSVEFCSSTVKIAGNVDDRAIVTSSFNTVSKFKATHNNDLIWTPAGCDDGNSEIIFNYLQACCFVLYALKRMTCQIQSLLLKAQIIVDG